MALFSFFKSQRARQFEYKPLFYNKEKEEFQERVKRIEEEMGIRSNNNNISYKPGIRRGTMRSYLKTETKKNKASSSIRLIIILFILLALTYYFLIR